jgi:8-oxo-dGTP diphosphatase
VGGQERGHEAPITTVDVVMLTLTGDGLSVVLVRRGRPPYQGALALPGGYIHVDEDDDLMASAMRVVEAKSGVAPSYLEQLATFSGLGRDPRGWSISVAYYAFLRAEAASSLAPGTEIHPIDRLPPLAFDHDRIVAVARARIRSKASYSVLPAYFLPEEFTLAELQDVYERVMGETLDKSSFRRKVDEAGLVAGTGSVREGGMGRPAQMFRIADPARVTLDRDIARSSPSLGGPR